MSTKKLSKTNSTNQILEIKVSQLAHSPFNVRTVKSSNAGIKELASNILSVGLLNNLVVHPMNKSKYGVIAGNRRFLAFQYLLKNNLIDDNYLVLVKVISDEKGIEISFAENSHREQMHIYDQIISFKKMSEKGLTIANISASLGYSDSHVKRMISLSVINPDLLELLKTDEIKIEHLKKLSLITDHNRQKEIWDLTKETGLYRLSKLVEENKTRYNCDNRAMFVGLEEYKKRGGTITNDLFQDEDNILIDDPVLMENLFKEKIQNIAESIQKKEGWKFFKIYYSYIEKFQDERNLEHVENTGLRELTKDEQKEINQLESQIKKYEIEQKKLSQLEELTFKDHQNLDDINHNIHECQIKIDNIKENLEIYNTKNLGFIVIFNGCNLNIMRGYKEITIDDNNNKATNDKEKFTHSKELTKTLTAFRSLIIQNELKNDQKLCTALLAHSFIVSLFNSDYNPYFKLSLSNENEKLLNLAETEIDKNKFTILNDLENLKKSLPDDFEQNFEFLLAYSIEELFNIINLCFSLSYSHVCEDENYFKSKKQFIKIDANLYWKQDKAEYLSRLNRHSILKIAKDFINDDEYLRLSNINKKSDLINEVNPILIKNNYKPIFLS